MDPLEPFELLDVRLPADETDADDSFVWTDDVDKSLPMRMVMMIMNKNHYHSYGGDNDDGNKNDDDADDEK